MSLFEKSLQSFVTNSRSALFSGSTQPILCIAETTPYPSIPIQQSLFYKLTNSSSDNDNKTNPRQPQTSQTDSTTTPIIIAVTRATHPYLCSDMKPANIKVITPTTLTTDAKFSSTTTSTTLFSPRTLMEQIYTTITLSQPQDNNEWQRPVIVFVDSLHLIMENYNPSLIPQFLNALLTLPSVSGLIYTLSTDTILPPGSDLIGLEMDSKRMVLGCMSGVDLFDSLTANATTLYQTLPPPHSHPTAILSCHISHRSSNGKIVSETVQLQPHQGKPVLVTSVDVKTNAMKNATSQSSSSSNDPTALPDGLKDLPFNLALTPHQIQQRSQVELPYAHAGQATQDGNNMMMKNNNANTSTTRNMGLLSSAPLRKTNFEEVVDDDDDDEDEEL